MVEQFVERVGGEVFAAAVAATRISPDVWWRFGWVCLVWQHRNIGVWSGCRAWRAGGSEAAGSVVEGELAAVSDDLPAFPVQFVVMEAAQQDTVVEVGETTVLGDSGDVVGFDETGGWASRELTRRYASGTVA